MEKDYEYGVPWFWKRVSVGTWVKGGSRQRGDKVLSNSNISKAEIQKR